MRYGRFLRYGALAIVLLLAVAGVSGYVALRASLPAIDGDIVAKALARPATIERDAEGTPTIRGESRRDLAYATGYAHGQDRFFQMDLMRRAAAGELSDLLGPSLLDTDKKLRIHAFRAVAGQVIAAATQEERALLEVYTMGVNDALAQSGARPWEYLLLRSQPAPWLIEDSVLVAFSMYLNLNDSSGEDELKRAQLRETLAPQLFSFLHPFGTEWDAPVVGSSWRAAPMPGPDSVDLRGEPARASAASQAAAFDLEEREFPGSNSWAVAGSHTTDGAALLANDMHLGLRLPHVWYRARLIVAAGPEARDLVGVTLPGMPMLIAGSNGHVAWGYTNSYGDWTDLVEVDVDPQDPRRYLSAQGSEGFDVRHETIRVRGQDAVDLEVKATRWGPIVDKNAAGKALALAWTAHHSQATNVRMMDLETAKSLEEAITAANRAGGPVQNFLVADAHGRIGWSLMGQVPVRANYDSTFPASWRAPETGWTGWRTPEEYPRIIDPQTGRLWTANARTIDGETWLAFLGDGGFDLGARAAQIRDDLLSRPTSTANDMVAIQLDDRALFLSRWRDLLLELLNHSALEGHPPRAVVRGLIEGWSGRAAADDVGYRLVRTARLQIRKDVFEWLTAPARAAYPERKFSPASQFEGPLWQLVTARPAHMLDPKFSTWEQALLASLDTAMASLSKDCPQLESCTWGAANTLSMRHPLSGAVPLIGRWLDMPAEPLPGDSSMPRVQGATFGASERLVVSPGKESSGYFQMPGGPVDHPLSPFYGAGHDAWAKGEPRPLLPGDTRHTLRLAPAQ